MSKRERCFRIVYESREPYNPDPAIYAASVRYEFEAAHYRRFRWLPWLYQGNESHSRYASLNWLWFDLTRHKILKGWQPAPRPEDAVERPAPPVWDPTPVPIDQTRREMLFNVALKADDRTTEALGQLIAGAVAVASCALLGWQSTLGLVSAYVVAYVWGANSARWAWRAYYNYVTRECAK